MSQSNRVSDFRDFAFFVSKGNPFLRLFCLAVGSQEISSIISSEVNILERMLLM